MRNVRFVETGDGLSLAWTRSGRGRPLVKAAAWLTHLEHDDVSPVWSHWVRFLEGNFDYIRYDERGCGLSDRAIGTPDITDWADDLSRVVDRADPQEPFVLLGMSQGAGTAVAYAAQNPDRVSHLVLCGGYVRGAAMRGDPKMAALYDAIAEVFRAGWDDPNPAFKEVFTRRFVPDGDPEKIEWFNDLCRRTTTPEVGAELLRLRARMDASDWTGDVRCPTLILHAENDSVVPMSEGLSLARSIPNAEFCPLPGQNHILQADDPAWGIFCDKLLEFTGARSLPATAGLTAREQEILDLMCAAKSNKEIARELGTSDKTVRNTATRIFAKLGVATRAEAIVKVGKS